MVQLPLFQVRNVTNNESEHPALLNYFIVVCPSERKRTQSVFYRKKSRRHKRKKEVKQKNGGKEKNSAYHYEKLSFGERMKIKK